MKSSRLSLSFVLAFFVTFIVQSQVKEIIVDLDKPFSKASHLFNSIHYTKLETSRNCLLRYPVSLTKDGDVWIIQDMQVFAFSSSGKFLNNFGSLGKGPGEFTMINDALVDTRGKNVEILSGSGRLVYNYEGKFINKKPAFSVSSFGKTETDQYLFYNSYYPIVTDRNGNYQKGQTIILADSKGEIVADLSDNVNHFGKFRAGMTPTSIGSFDGTLNIVIDRSLSVYKLINNELFEKYRYYIIPNSIRTHLPKRHNDFNEQDFKEYRKGNVVEINSFREAEDLLTCWINTRKGLLYIIVKKPSYESYIIPLEEFSNDINQLPFGHIISIDGSTITTRIEAADFIDKMEIILSDPDTQQKNQFMDSNKAILDIYQNTSREDNPIIATYYLK